MSRPTDVNDHATFESRSAGGHARAARYREVRDEAQRNAVAQLAGMTAKALLTLEAILDGEDDPDAFRAAKDVLDRVLGRPSQAVEVTGGDGEPSAVENRRGVGGNAAVMAFLSPV